MPKRTVSILTTSHFEADGKRCVYGGAERYGIELTRLFLEMGWEVNWWQAGLNWTRFMLPGVIVHGVPVQDSFAQTCSSLNRAFNEQAGPVDLAIYFVTFLAYPTALPRSISISHGIFWDYPSWENRIGGALFREEWLQRMERALYAPTRVVSVDTATISWASWHWPALLNRFAYIPNFVDTVSFTPPDPTKPRNDGRIRILFPRRLTTVRGIGETMQAATSLIRRYPALEFHFVGRGHDGMHERQMLSWAAENENIYYYWRPPEGMKEIYQNMDICVIPSKSTEGTSLSCLEAMACGLPVIAGRAGGLPELFVHNYNGLVINPTAAGLIEALVYLIDHEQERHRLGGKARETARCFDLAVWKKRWTALIGEVLGN